MATDKLAEFPGYNINNFLDIQGNDLKAGTWYQVKQRYDRASFAIELASNEENPKTLTFVDEGSLVFYVKPVRADKTLWHLVGYQDVFGLLFAYQVVFEPVDIEAVLGE